MKARFFDGRSAREQIVDARVDAGALIGEGAGISFTWPVAKLNLLSADRAGWRLSCDDDADARLIVARDAEGEALLAALGLRARDRGRRIAIVAAVAAASAALIALIFFVAPLAAGPLARATPADVEARLGANMASQISVVLKPCAVASPAPLAPLMHKLAPDLPTQVTIVNTPIRNAFALPGGRVMVTRGLLEGLEAPDELAAVLAHEIGHAAARDGLVSLYRNAGLGLVLEAVTGGSGVAQQLVLLAGQLTELRYTRRQEEAADNYALAAMARAELDPAALARAFERLRPEPNPAAPKQRLRIPFGAEEWLLSHPGLDRRIAHARAAGRTPSALAMSEGDWRLVQSACAKEGE